VKSLGSALVSACAIFAKKHKINLCTCRPIDMYILCVRNLMTAKLRPALLFMGYNVSEFMNQID
jgi:hypothetical protein